MGPLWQGTPLTGVPCDMTPPPPVTGVPSWCFLLYKLQFADVHCVFVSRQCCIEVLNRTHLSQFAKHNTTNQQKTKKFLFGSAAFRTLYYFPHIVLLKKWGPSGGGNVFEQNCFFNKFALCVFQVLDVKQCAWGSPVPGVPCDRGSL